MRALNRKLLRDVWRLRGQVVSIALVVACGVMSVVTMRSVFDSLVASRAAYYAGYRFADVFASVKRAPQTVARRIEGLPGVGAVRTRVVLEVTLDVPGLEEAATGRLVSIPVPREPVLNDLHLRRGRWPAGGARDEVLVSESFAVANRLAPGDELGAVVNGSWERLRIVGVAISPEYVYEVSAGQIFPDNRRFGVLWMDREVLAPAYDMEGAFNDVALALSPGASPDRVVHDLDRLLAPYGGIGAYPRADQPSHRILEDEIRQNRVNGTVAPAVFLAVAAFLLHIVLSRLVSTQRDQIAVLKAFGYSDLDVGRHFLRFALAAVLLGAAVGIGMGIWLGGALVGVYTDYFRFPVLEHRTSWALVAGAVAVAGGAAVVGALSAVRGAVRLPPAEAMRPEPPARFRPGPVERLGIGRLFSAAGRMVVRNLERRPVRALVSALGVGLSVAIVIVGLFFFDAIAFMMDLQFRYAQREDLTVLFTAQRGPQVRHDLASIPGVQRVETFRIVPVRLRVGPVERQTAITGLEAGGQLRRIVGRDYGTVPVPPSGLVLTDKLAEVLGVGPGDAVDVEVLEGERRTARVPVAGTVDELFGTNAYMDVGSLARVLGEGPAVSGAYLRVDPGRAAQVHASLKRMPAVAGVSTRLAMVQGFEENIARSLGLSTSILVVFACVIALGVIYNGARIALSERGRELASLRVLGFTRREVAAMLLGEQAAVTALGIPLGFAIGAGLCMAMVRAFEAEVFRIPLIISPRTFLLAAAVAAGSAVLAGLAVRRRLDRLDLIGVLKTRE